MYIVSAKTLQYTKTTAKSGNRHRCLTLIEGKANGFNGLNRSCVDKRGESIGQSKGFDSDTVYISNINRLSSAGLRLLNIRFALAK